MENVIAADPPKVYSLLERKEIHKNDHKQGNKQVLCEWYKQMSHEISKQGHLFVWVLKKVRSGIQTQP